jgi:ABC-2 type transport system ATP-binding protein
LREGHIVADDTVAAVRQRAGTDDLEQAFLRLIKQKSAEAA